MKTYLDCIPCFYKQALVAARKSGADEIQQKEIMDETARIIPAFPLSRPPVEMARNIYGMIRERTGVEDPYRDEKLISNRMAMKVFPELRARAAQSEDPLLAAVELAIAGNVIDYVSRDSIDLEGKLSEIIHREEKSIQREISGDFDFERFRKDLGRAEKVLYLADNAGETAFDRILIERINDTGRRKDVVYAVKGRPVINDAVLEDALFCGLDKVARVISSGSDVPGTVLSFCSEEFMEIFRDADIIISKGQGNFEALSGTSAPVYFLFLVKCPVIARHAGTSLGDVILRRG
ncbi:MAG: ARMT1-like domain-containing protein [Candidatus Krumholzibacteriales bacterium]